MSDTPKFEVIDRRKFKAAEEEQESRASATPADLAPAVPEPISPGPRLVVSEPMSTVKEVPPPASATNETEFDDQAGTGFPPAPTAEQSREQKLAYDVSAQRLEELVRAQNPAVGAQPPITFENLVQQFYVSAMIQMGAGAQEGQRPRVDILGARTTIDLLTVLAEKTRGSLTEAEDRALQTVLSEARMAFIELTSMINLQAMQPPQPPPPGRR